MIMAILYSRGMRSNVGLLRWRRREAVAVAVVGEGFLSWGRSCGFLDGLD